MVQIMKNSDDNNNDNDNNSRQQPSKVGALPPSIPHPSQKKAQIRLNYGLPGSHFGRGGIEGGTLKVYETASLKQTIFRPHFVADPCKNYMAVSIRRNREPQSRRNSRNHGL